MQTHEVPVWKNPATQLRKGIPAKLLTDSVHNFLQEKLFFALKIQNIAFKWK